jgi:hypothetical protein
MVESTWDLLKLKCPQDLRDSVIQSFIHFTNIDQARVVPGCSSLSYRKTPALTELSVCGKDRLGKAETSRQRGSGGVIYRLRDQGCWWSWGLAA